jgi:hypothetical protein
MRPSQASRGGGGSWGSCQSAGWPSPFPALSEFEAPAGNVPARYCATGLGNFDR